MAKRLRVLVKWVSRILAKTGITPNQITIMGVFLNLGVAYLIAKGQTSYLLLGILIWGVGLFDVIDGDLARITDRDTLFGKFLDSVSDRYSDAFIYTGIAIYFLGTGNTVYVLPVLIAMAGSFAVSYTRAKAESIDRECEVGFMTRAVRIFILGAGFCSGQILWAVIIIAFFSNVTSIHRIIHVYKQLAE